MGASALLVILSPASAQSALQALAVFLGAASGHRFLLEFLDTGGLQMTTQMLTNKKIAEAERIRALQLLASIANSGFTYKQMICRDFHGEDAVLKLRRPPLAGPSGRAYANPNEIDVGRKKEEGGWLAMCCAMPRPAPMPVS